MIFATVGLAATTIFCALKWFIQYINTLAIIKYMIDKKYTLPTDKESKVCFEWWMNHLDWVVNFQRIFKQ